VQKLHEVLRALPEAAAKFASERIKGADREIRRMVRSKWEESIVWSDKGDKIIDSPGNLKLMLDNMPEWTGLVAYDESKDRLFWTRDPPELAGMKRPRSGQEIREYDWVYVAHWFSSQRQVTFPKMTAADQLVAAGQDNAHNSLVGYIEGLTWDGKGRVGSWLTTFCGAEDTPVTRKVGRAWLISAIARALAPGCQVDHVLVLEGKQGSGKTSVFRILGGEWYLGHLPRLEDKDARHVLSGAWLVEMQELANTRASRIELVKAYLTERWDQYRPPYGRSFVKRARRCVFGASVNDDEYVADSTGARRFWPVKIGVPHIEALSAERDQLWAEARELYLSGEQWWVPAGTAEADALHEEQAVRLMSDPWDTMVERYVQARDMVSTTEILGSIPGLEPGRYTPRDAQRVGSIMQTLGYVQRRVDVGGKRERRWVLAVRSPLV
jgi:putative DNA primase/helicase